VAFCCGSCRGDVHLEIGANNPFDSSRLARTAAGGVKVYLFEPNPRWRDVCYAWAERFRGECVPAAAWIRDGHLPFHVHMDRRGIGASLFNGTVYGTRRRAEVVEAVDLAAWMQRRLPEGEPITARMDIEGAEYAVMRHLMLRGQACRLRSLVFEGHAVYSSRHAPFRALDVLLPWLLKGCGEPAPEVEVQRYYCTPRSACDERIKWRPEWCKDCAMLDDVVDVHLL